MDQKTKALLVNAAGFVLITGTRALVSRLRKRPDSFAARLLLAPRGPNTGVRWMSRRELFRSGGVFLAWGILLFGIYAASLAIGGDATFDSPLLAALSFLWAFAALMALGGGIYLCVRGLLRSAEFRPPDDPADWDPEPGKPPPIG